MERDDLLVGRAIATGVTRTWRVEGERAGLDFVRDPMEVPQIPNWNRVTSALPDFLDELRVAVDADAAES